jgi:hypothetical protein
LLDESLDVRDSMPGSEEEREDQFTLKG